MYQEIAEALDEANNNPKILMACITGADLYIRNFQNQN